VLHADAAELALALAAAAPRFSGLPGLPACLRVLSHLLLLPCLGFASWLQSHLRHAHRAAHHAGVLHPHGAVKKPDRLLVLAASQLSDAGWMEQEGDRRGDKRTAATARTCRGGQGGRRLIRRSILVLRCRDHAWKAIRANKMFRTRLKEAICKSLGMTVCKASGC
jgi:hypothetical protein